MSARVALLVSFLLVLLAPASARAAASWVHDSAVAEQSTGYLKCAGTAGGTVDQVLPSIDYAEAYLDPAALPALGGVEYVRVQWYATGGDYCREQGGTGAAPEIIPPSGTELAISPEYPALCGFDILQDAAPCPVITVAGDYGGTLLADGRSGQPTLWPVSDGLNKTRLQVPLRFTAQLTSFATSAERWCNAGPCPAAETGGRVQFTVRFVPGNGGTPSAPLVTSVGVAGGAPPAPAPAPPAPPAQSGSSQPGKGKPKALLVDELPARVSRASLRRGLSLRVRVEAGATARARLLVGKLALATASRRARKAGTVPLRLTAGPRALRRLGSGSRKAKLVLSVAKRAKVPQRQVFALTIGP